MRKQQFPLKRLVPGVGLNHPHLKSPARIGKQKRENFFFQPCPVVISFRYVVDGLFQMILIHIVRREKHHIQLLGRPFHRIVDKLQHVFVSPVIPVHDADIVPAGGADPFVPG